jgi:hypothetical protein
MGFIAAARRPAREKPRSKAAETSVLPISVSVPVTKSERGCVMFENVVFMMRSPPC